MSREVQVYDGDGVETPERRRINASLRLAEILRILKRHAVERLQFTMTTKRPMLLELEKVCSIIESICVDAVITGNGAIPAAAPGDTIAMASMRLGSALGMCTKDHYLIQLGFEATTCMGIVGNIIPLHLRP